VSTGFDAVDDELDVLDAALALQPANARLRVYAARYRLAVWRDRPEGALLRGALEDAGRVLFVDQGDLDALAVAEEAAWALGDAELALHHRASADRERARRLEGVPVTAGAPGSAAEPVPLTPLPASVVRRPGSTHRRIVRRMAVLTVLGVVSLEAALAVVQRLV
jgi:hypothetical protein